MKKLKDKIINNKKYILGIITGILISRTTVYAATVISAANVSYSNTTSSLSSTNVQEAIDELYNKVDTTEPLDIISPNRLYANNKTICVQKNNKLNCFRPVESSQEQMMNVFTSKFCYYRFGIIFCNDNIDNFSCEVASNHLRCKDEQYNVDCSINSSGSLNCTR